MLAKKGQSHPSKMLAKKGPGGGGGGRRFRPCGQTSVWRHFAAEAVEAAKKRANAYEIFASLGNFAIFVYFPK